jgi:hypothetical protein
MLEGWASEEKVAHKFHLKRLGPGFPLSAHSLDKA